MFSFHRALLSSYLNPPGWKERKRSFRSCTLFFNAKPSGAIFRSRTEAAFATASAAASRRRRIVSPMC
ncbi:hypothetical protein PUN28_006795 [Cardiocondyla obscurior]|uniref:Uncharacterized protein n=1 Tax=Cardiocondyla obscurior TaxID=286306 RepID=A0AAW2G638_9HYME